MSESELLAQLHEAKLEIEQLRLRISRLELHAQPASLPTVLPDTMLLDDSFLKRAFAVFGHNTVASLIVTLPFYAIVFIIMMLTLL